MVDTIEQLREIVNTEAIYRNAFPACRVFVFGYEVTNDVISVRPNQSGGSLERSPSTCAITLSNKNDKYIITRSDMAVIGKQRQSITESIKHDMDLSQKQQAFDPNDGFNTKGDYSSYEIDKDGNLRYEGNNNVIYPLGGGKPAINLTSLEAQELIPRLALASDEEILYLLGAYGYNDITLEDARSIAAVLSQEKARLVSSGSSKDVILGSFDESEIPFNIKQQVVKDKSSHTVTLKSFNPESAEFLNYEDRVAFDYPYQEGDCIFHANDPVRVVFRDPFDPRIWYWMFTGFVDIWTEDVDTNLASTVTLTCTDVSKMIRYSVVQLNTQGLDPNIEEILAVANQAGTNTSSYSGLILMKEIFEGLRIQEILELVFFGSNSVIKLLDPYMFALENIINTLEGEEEFIQFAISRFGMTVEEAYEFVTYGLDSSSVETVRTKLKNAVEQIFQSKSLKRIGKLNWDGIITPRGVQFKRKDNERGVHFYVYGSPTDLDVSFGAEGVEDFYTWNETIHHRVRTSDLITMRNTQTEAITPSPNYTADQIIHMIGTDLAKFPVGHGRVFYFAPAGLTDLTDEGIMDKGMNAGVSAASHSVFKDRLSLLYDVAEMVDWRFYASPRGDIIFEVPFYDHDPKDFFGTEFQNSDLSDTTKSKSQRYDEIFQQEYSGNYSEENVKELTELSFEMNTEDADLLDFSEPLREGTFNYSKDFVITKDEQLNLSNTFSDRGIVTVYGVQKNTVQFMQDLNIQSVMPFVFVLDKSLIPTLGVRVDTSALRTFIGSEDGAKLYAALELGRLNAEARSISIPTIPKYSLMVNRPVLVKFRNYYANIVSINHSFVWNSDLSTSMNLNQIRAWSGVYDSDGNPVYRHFYDRDKPFNFAHLMSRAYTRETKNKK